jgi:acyl-coenzyme A thioesterase PaaI-like protein
MQLNNLLIRAERSNIALRLLNFGLRRLIPFNAPHKFNITQIEKDSLTITLPYIRKNKNHVNGIHACALATLCEYISGLSIIRELSQDNYRIILKDIEMAYHYQAKMEVQAKFSLPPTEIEAIKEGLSIADAVFRRYDIEVYDAAKNHICTGKIHWQIKPWNKTKTLQ